MILQLLKSFWGHSSELPLETRKCKYFRSMPHFWSKAHSFFNKYWVTTTILGSGDWIVSKSQFSLFRILITFYYWRILVTIVHPQKIKPALKRWLFAIINDIKNNTLLFIKSFHNYSKSIFINGNIVVVSHYFETDHNSYEWDQIKHKLRKSVILFYNKS